jgi:hypothetical protein
MLKHVMTGGGTLLTDENENICLANTYTTCSKELLLDNLHTASRRIRYSMFLLTLLFTPWIRVLLEKLTVYKLVKKFPAFYGTRMLITASKSARHLSLS